MKQGHRVVKVMRRFKHMVLNLESHKVPWKTKRGESKTQEMEVYRNHSGDYVGARHRGRRDGLTKNIFSQGIAPELASPNRNTCTIGRDPDGVWYGWSHRAGVGFRKGDRIFNARWPKSTDKTPLREHGDRVIKTEADAKLAAIRFARSVS